MIVLGGTSRKITVDNAVPVFVGPIQRVDANDHSDRKMKNGLWNSR